MKFNAQQLCDQFPDLIINSINADRQFSKLSAVENYDNESLIFISDDSQLSNLSSPLPPVVVTNHNITEKLIESGICVLEVNNVRLAQALIKQRYSDYDASDAEWPDIHPSAVIHASVKLGKNVRIGANSVIGKSVTIGNNSSIRANCVIEHGVVIGEDCIVNNLVNIGFNCTLGDRVIIRPGVIIGNEGFGFAQDEQRHYHRIPHTGIVEIQDDVQLGSNCNIDRGTYGKTVIARGVKIDSLCHVAHNVFIDEDTLIVSQSGIAGSSRLGKRVIASGQTGVLDHKTISDDAILVHRCGVTEDIPGPGMWAGTPPKPFKEYVRNLDSAKRLKKMEERFEQRLAELEARFNKDAAQS